MCSIFVDMDASSISILADLAPAVEFGWVGRFYLFALVAGVPLIAVVQPLDQEHLPPRRSLYLSGIIGILMLTGLAWGALALEGIPLTDIGLHGVDLPSFMGWTIAVTVGALLGNLVISRIAALLGVDESPLTYHLMPKTSEERGLFALLSAAAGLGEELTYHGYVVAGLAAWTGSGWWAAIIANVAFGVLHGYQGYIGLARGGLMGMVLTLPIILGAGLWPGIVAHFLVDAMLGLGLWRLMVPRDRIPVEA